MTITHHPAQNWAQAHEPTPESIEIHNTVSTSPQVGVIAFLILLGGLLFAGSAFVSTSPPQPDSLPDQSVIAPAGAVGGSNWALTEFGTTVAIENISSTFPALSPETEARAIAQAVALFHARGQIGSPPSRVR